MSGRQGVDGVDSGQCFALSTYNTPPHSNTYGLTTSFGPNRSKLLTLCACLKSTGSEQCSTAGADRRKREQMMSPCNCTVMNFKKRGKMLTRAYGAPADAAEEPGREGSSLLHSEIRRPRPVSAVSTCWDADSKFAVCCRERSVYADSKRSTAERTSPHAAVKESHLRLTASSSCVA